MKITNHSKRILFILIGSIYVTLFFNGCKKIIAIDQPINTVTPEKVFSSDQVAYSALAGAYSQLMSNTGSITFSNGGTSIYAGLNGDELASFNGALNTIDYPFETNKILITNPTPDGLFWAPAYRVINTVNGIIEGTQKSTSPGLTDTARKQLTGESKFIRAFSYFYLTNLFGDAPLVLSTDFNITAKSPNSTPQALYGQMVQDLLDAQGLLRSDYSISGNQRIRANKWAATALLARVYLYQKDWKNADEQASAVIANSQYSLESDLNNVFLANSNEAILQFQQNPITPPAAGTYESLKFIPPIQILSFPQDQQAQYLDPSIFLDAAFYFIPTYYMTPELSGAFETNDQRLTKWASYTPTPVAAPYTGAKIYWSQKYTVNTSKSPSDVTQYYMVLRLAEQYLIRAEARAEEGNLAGAASDLNMIRTRSGLPPTKASTQTDLIAAIMHERQVELFTEWGHRLFDLKRTGQAATVLGAIAAKKPFNPQQLLLPIPPNEIKADAFLKQNPGY